MAEVCRDCLYSKPPYNCRLVRDPSGRLRIEAETPFTLPPHCPLSSKKARMQLEKR